MVNFAEIRKHILAGEDDSKEASTMRHEPPTSAWRTELDAFTTSAPLSLGAGLLGAAIYDGIANRSDDSTPIFEGTWKTLVVLSGAMLFGFGAGRLHRGTSARADIETYEAIISKAEEEADEMEDEKKEVEERQNEAKQAESNLIFNNEAFRLTPSSSGLMGFGEYGAAVGQQGVSYRYMG